MALFRKKKTDAEGENEQASKKKRGRKKKEPVEPWGRRERILVLSVLLGTVITSSLLGLSARSWKLPGLPRLKVPKINTPFLGEETIILEGSKEDQKKKEWIISEFSALTNDLTGVYGLYIVRLDSGYSFGVNENEVFQAASLIKLPVMVAMYIEEEKGAVNGFSLNSIYGLRKEDKRLGAGSLRLKPEGYEVVYRDLVRLMASQSDNTAFAAAVGILGEAKVNEVVSDIGMVQTSLSENTTTALGIGNFFRKLYLGNLLTDENTSELVSFLTDTAYEDWITSGVPDNIQVAHKYGRETGVVNDAGIVFSDNPYVVVILSKGVTEKEADEVIPELSQSIFNILSD